MTGVACSWVQCAWSSNFVKNAAVFEYVFSPKEVSVLFYAIVESSNCHTSEGCMLVQRVTATCMHLIKRDAWAATVHAFIYHI
jgi:hypothetical protein